MTPQARLTAALADRYRIERELGAGGMATVYVAEDLKHRRKVAIKVLRPELAAALGAERFLREIETTANLRHPHILPLYDSGEAGGFLFYVMPLVEGESLRDRITRERQLPIEDALSIAREVGDALGYAHGRGIIHRDIKPENILLEGGHAVVADFGISRAVSAAGADKLTGTGMSIGTPSYMSPEQATGEENLDGRSDLYALGCVLYEMLGGQPPFTGPTVESLVHQHLVVAPPPITNLRPTVPVAVAGALARTLAKNPADRFNPAAQFVQALSGTGATPTAAERPVAPSSRRWKMQAIVAAGVLVAAMLVWTLRPGEDTAAPGAVEQSLAVLPFESVGGDTANAYFAEGIADELTNALAKLSGLRVAGRSSAGRFRGKGATAQEVGAALQVGSVLEGTVRRSAERIRITAQLSSASSGLVLWTDSYEREVKDVFALQDDITRAIVGALSVRLTAAPRDTATAGTRDPQAYDLYLRGLYFLRRRGEALRRAEDYFQQAIARDSSFARAHALLTVALLTQPYYLPIHVGELLPRARAAARRAVALDPGLSEAHMAMGLAAYHAFDWSEAEAESKQAIAIDPTSSEAHYRYGFLLFTMGRLRECIAMFERSKALDPLYSLPTSYLGWTQILAGNAEAGLAEARRAVTLDSTVVGNHTILALAYLEANQPDEARAVALAALQITPDPRRRGWMTTTLARAGDTVKAREILGQLVRTPEGTPGRIAALTFAYLAVGDTARGLSYMEEAAAGDGDLVLATPPMSRLFDAVRASPRFAAVLRRFNLDVARLTQADGGRSQ